MRRALLLAALALPAVALGQIRADPGQVIEFNNFNPDPDVLNSYINAAHCAGTDQLDVEWQIIRLDTTIPIRGTYRLFASSAVPPTTGDPGVANFCNEEDVETPTVIRAGQVGSAAATVGVQTLPISGTQIATVTGRVCGEADEGDVVYVCAHLYDENGTTRRGFASGKFQIQVTAPNPPTEASAGPGDTRINVNWTASATGAADVDEYVAEARLPNSTEVVSSATTRGTSTTINGLTNGVTYDVFVRAVSFGGNLSTEVSAGTATPAAVDDFWESYRAAGGRETGGCASGGAAGILAVAGVLAALRRRK